MTKKRFHYRMIFILVLLGIWQGTAYAGIFSQALFPKVETILIRFVDLLLYEGLVMKTLYSIFIVLLAMAISLALSVILTCLGRRSAFVRESTHMTHAIASPLPGIAILPLVLIWLGVSQSAMLLIMVHATLWPLWAQVSQSVDRLDQRYSRFIRAFRIPPARRFWHIYVLGIRPELMTGLRISWSRGWRALISVEMIFGMVGSQTGLGWLIFERRMYMDTPGLYAGLLAIALCGIFFETFVFKAGPVEVRHEAVN